MYHKYHEELFQNSKIKKKNDIAKFKNNFLILICHFDIYILIFNLTVPKFYRNRKFTEKITLELIIYPDFGQFRVKINHY